MGFWNDGIRDRSRSRSPSRRSNAGYYASRPSYSRSAASFFSFGGSGGSRASRNGGHSSRARPRSGFINRIRHFLRKIYEYMRRNPLKVFFLVIMPLITGGALTKLLGQFGVRLPRSLENLAGGQRAQTERFYARGGARDFPGGSALPGMSGGVSESIGSLMSIAKMFI
jgi:hypothetical protein